MDTRIMVEARDPMIMYFMPASTASHWCFLKATRAYEEIEVISRKT